MEGPTLGVTEVCRSPERTMQRSTPGRSIWPGHRVVFYSESLGASNPGGGEVQLLKTAEALRQRGVSVECCDCDSRIDRTSDLIHIFGTTHGALRIAREASRQGLPVVLSTISWYDPWVSWRLEAAAWRRCRAVAGWGIRRIAPSVPSWRRELMHLAHLLLPNSRAEADQLRQLFRVPESRIAVVPNGVDPQFASGDPALFEGRFGIRDFVLVPGRIEPRKNQLTVLRSLWGSGLPVVVLGDAVEGHGDYAEQCRRAADAGTVFIGRLDHPSDMLRSAYSAARVVVLASWFETPGLAALEGALAGASVVVTDRGSAREYFGDLASYVDPRDAGTIRQSVRSAFVSPPRTRLQESIAGNYLWSHVAEATLAAYDRVFQRSTRLTGNVVAAAA